MQTMTELKLNEEIARVNGERDRLREVLRAIVEDASPCSTACNQLVSEALSERAAALVNQSEPSR